MGAAPLSPTAPIAPQCLFRERIRPQLQLYDLARCAFSRIGMEGGASRVRRPQAFTFPAGLCVINASVEPLRIETQRVRNRQHYPLAVLQSEQATHFVPGCDWYILAEAKRVELIDP